MRLVSLQLTRYGNFAANRIDFDPLPGRVNLLFAPNGGGKSVVRQAFCDLLFGISGQTPMGFRYGYSGMRITAEAIAPDGTRVAFGRRKGQGNTLVDADGNLDESGALARLLGRADRGLLERLFALDTERLRRGGDELLASGGAVADALLAAGGLRGAKDLRRSLEAAADALAPAKRSAQRPFYRALDGLQEARRRAAGALLRPDDWVRMERDLAEAEAQQAEQNRAAATEARQMAQLQRLRRVRVPMAERDAAEVWLAAHPDAPALAPSFADRLAEAHNRLPIARQQLEREEERRSEIATELARIVVEPAILAAAAEIERLSEQAGAVGKALTDIPKRDAEHVAVLARIVASLRKLGSDLPPERVAEVIPNRAAESRARMLIASYGAVAAAAAQTPAAVASAARDVAEIVAELGGLPASDGSDTLAPLVKEIRAGGDPTDRAERLPAPSRKSRRAGGGACRGPGLVRQRRDFDRSGFAADRHLRTPGCCPPCRGSRAPSPCRSTSEFGAAERPGGSPPVGDNGRERGCGRNRSCRCASPSRSRLATHLPHSLRRRSSHARGAATLRQGHAATSCLRIRRAGGGSRSRSARFGSRSHRTCRRGTPGAG